MNDGRPNRRRWLTAYAPLAIWIGIIIALGSGVGAMNETSRFIRPLLEYLFPSTSPETLSIFHGYIRKLAHITEYAILAVLAKRAFSSLSRPWTVAMGIVALVAMADELNQSFDPRRTGTLMDVLIDLVGGFLGLAIAWIAARIRQKKS